jgi:hypothetical protein
MARIDPDNVKPLHDPYKTQRLRRGDRTVCLYLDKPVIITLHARLSWLP